jgi:hypothetical protein
MALIGGKRKVNKSLKAWVAFVKKVQKEEKLSYKDAIYRAKVRKDKGEKWMMGGSTPDGLTTTPMDVDAEETIVDNEQGEPMVVDEQIVETPNEDVELGNTVVGEEMNTATYGGKRRRTMRRRSARKSRGRARTARKSRGRGRGRN